MKSVEEVKKFLKDSVEWLIDQDMGCTTLKLDDRLAICVGWLPGYGEERREDCIQSASEPDYAINAGIKVWTSDDMRTDYEFINMPYYKDGEVLMTDVSVEHEDDYGELAQYLLDEYEGMKDLEMSEDGEIIETKPEEAEVETEVKTEVEEESLKEEKVDKEALEFYVKNWHEGDNITVTADLLNVLEQSLEMINKYKNESCKKELKETFAGEDVIDDLVDRAISKIDDGEDLDDAIMEAIDEGLIYSKDIYDLLEHYGSIEDSEILSSYYDDLYSDIYSQVSDYIPDRDEEEEEEEEEVTDESLKLKEEPVYGLEPEHDSRKSFYGKAKVDERADGSKVLYSYGTPVCYIDKDGKVSLLRKGYLGWFSSATTLRHVKEFLQQNGKKIASRSELDKLYPTVDAYDIL